ncbi:MAG: hypothetical protein JWO08_3918 [Verrucomicrobiaceae bacterium]|nr:hypothetical protein [Verrucomicrobiaceae bacterium]
MFLPRHAAHHTALHGAMLDIRGWLQRVGVTIYCYVFLGCLSAVGPSVS